MLEPATTLTGAARALADSIYAVAGTEPKRPLRVGIFDDFVRGTAGAASLIGAATPLPHAFNYHDWCHDPARVDVVMATVRDAPLLAQVRRDVKPTPPLVCFLQECRELYPHPSDELLCEFDLVLTHDFAMLDRLKHARWCSLVGTQLQIPIAQPTSKLAECCQPKRELVSLLDSGKRITEGHRIRLELGQHPTLRGHVYGHGVGNFVSDKWTALGPYKFNVAVENSLYPSWVTEKLIDCFIAKTVPIYYGDASMLGTLGFDVSGIIPFTDKRHAEALLAELPLRCMDWYESRRSAVAHNFARAMQLTTPEVLVSALVRREFDIARVRVNRTHLASPH